jgi:hypothetical protein
MSIGYSVTGGLVETFLLGKVTFREMSAAIEVAKSHPALRRPWRLLIDASEVSALPERGEFPAIAAMFAALKPDLDGDCAIVVPQDNASYLLGVALRAQAAQHGIDLGVYRDRETAMAWLKGTAIDGGH